MGYHANVRIATVLQIFIASLPKLRSTRNVHSNMIDNIIGMIIFAYYYCG